MRALNTVAAILLCFTLSGCSDQYKQNSADVFAQGLVDEQVAMELKSASIVEEFMEWAAVPKAKDEAESNILFEDSTAISELMQSEKSFVNVSKALNNLYFENEQNISLVETSWLNEYFRNAGYMLQMYNLEQEEYEGLTFGNISTTPTARNLTFEATMARESAPSDSNYALVLYDYSVQEVEDRLGIVFQYNVLGTASAAEETGYLKIVGEMPVYYDYSEYAFCVIDIREDKLVWAGAFVNQPLWNTLEHSWGNEVTKTKHYGLNCALDVTQVGDTIYYRYTQGLYHTGRVGGWGIGIPICVSTSPEDSEVYIVSDTLTDNKLTAIEGVYKLPDKWKASYEAGDLEVTISPVLEDYK